MLCQSAKSSQAFFYAPESTLDYSRGAGAVAQAGISEVAHLSDTYHKMAIFVAYLTTS